MTRWSHTVKSVHIHWHERALASTSLSLFRLICCTWCDFVNISRFQNIAHSQSTSRWRLQSHLISKSCCFWCWLKCNTYTAFKLFRKCHKHSGSFNKCYHTTHSSVLTVYSQCRQVNCSISACHWWVGLRLKQLGYLSLRGHTIRWANTFV